MLRTECLLAALQRRAREHLQPRPLSHRQRPIRRVRAEVAIHDETITCRSGVPGREVLGHRFGFALESIDTTSCETLLPQSSPALLQDVGELMTEQCFAVRTRRIEFAHAEVDVPPDGEGLRRLARRRLD